MNLIQAVEQAHEAGGIPWWGNGLITFGILLGALYIITRFNPDR
jgi:hypothetical protein